MSEKIQTKKELLEERARRVTTLLGAEKVFNDLAAEKNALTGTKEKTVEKNEAAHTQPENKKEKILFSFATGPGGPVKEFAKDEEFEITTDVSSRGEPVKIENKRYRAVGSHLSAKGAKILESLPIDKDGKALSKTYEDFEESELEYCLKNKWLQLSNSSENKKFLKELKKWQKQKVEKKAEPSAVEKIKNIESDIAKLVKEVIPSGNMEDLELWEDACREMAGSELPKTAEHGKKQLEAILKIKNLQAESEKLKKESAPKTSPEIFLKETPIEILKEEPIREIAEKDIKKIEALEAEMKNQETELEKLRKENDAQAEKISKLQMQFEVDISFASGKHKKEIEVLLKEKEKQLAETENLKLQSITSKAFGDIKKTRLETQKNEIAALKKANSEQMAGMEEIKLQAMKAEAFGSIKKTKYEFQLETQNAEISKLQKELEGQAEKIAGLEAAVAKKIKTREEKAQDIEQRRREEIAHTFNIKIEEEGKSPLGEKIRIGSEEAIFKDSESIQKRFNVDSVKAKQLLQERNEINDKYAHEKEVLIKRDEINARYAAELADLEKKEPARVKQAPVQAKIIEAVAEERKILNEEQKNILKGYRKDAFLPALQ